ncbi:MAG: hypothetical protein HKN09_06925 [Saprospiraceae bacterium]|nr:hypothetical protein [Saprospiraceae bacterium]
MYFYLTRNLLKENPIKKLFIGLVALIFILPAHIHAQEVSISSELTIRGYFSYDILGEVDDRIIVFRDRGFNKEVDVFNMNLEHTQFAEIFFEKKKVDIFSILGLDTTFQLVYGYFEADSMNFMMKRYDKAVVMQDSFVFHKIHKKDVRRRIGTVESEDKSKILLHTLDAQDRLSFILFDNNSKKTLWAQKAFVENVDLRNDFVEVKLLNSGEFILILKEEGLDENDDILRILVFDPFTGEYKNVRLNFNTFYRNNYHLDVDNANRQMILCGTYSEKKAKEVLGYYYINTNLDALTGSEIVYFLNFDDRLQNDLLQGKKKKSKVFNDIQVREIINRNDGGFLIVSEVSREYSRRNPYNNSYNRNAYNGGGYGGRGWIDYYNDDVLISNISPQNKQDWTKVLYKKQFSQDDEAVFSSFFMMKTPSRMRIIYNDEIKKSNTVSEYIMDPLGNIARNSLLSTEYQNMKLRFQDAIQVSANSLLVPSEKNYNLNLVRITY